MCDSKKGRYCPGRAPKGIARRRATIRALAHNQDAVLTAGTPQTAHQILTAAWNDAQVQHARTGGSPATLERNKDETERFLNHLNRHVPEQDRVPVPDDPTEQAAWAATSRTFDQMTGARPMDEDTRAKVAAAAYGDDAIMVRMDVPEDVQATLDTLHRANARPFLVGGCVRDAVLGNKNVKDWDIEVYGATPDTVLMTLRRAGRVDDVGKSFGVLKMTTRAGTDLDVSLPRTDSKTDAGGHRGFDVSVNPDLSTVEASSRRDFTMNALMYDPRVGCVVDHHGGVDDLRAGQLRHVSDAFDEDELRVLRGAQQSARFRLTGHPGTVAKCRSLAGRWDHIPKERVREQWESLTTKATEPSYGLRFLSEAGWDGHAPHLAQMNTPENQACTDRAAAAAQAQSLPSDRRHEVVLAAFTTDAGPDQSADFLTGIGSKNETKTRVRLLVSEQDAPDRPDGDVQVRALARRLHPASVREWAIVRDATGRSHTPWTARAENLGVLDKKEEPLLLGRHVLAAFGKPQDGRKIGDILADAAHDQEHGVFTTREQADAWLASRAPHPGSW